MSIRADALKWLDSKYGEMKGPIYTSKFYLAEQSWSKNSVWWIQIPLDVITSSQHSTIKLVCQTDPSKNLFHYINIPRKFLQENLHQFHQVGKIASLYLSTNPKRLFREERGTGQISFAEFVIH